MLCMDLIDSTQLLTLPTENTETDQRLPFMLFNWYTQYQIALWTLWWLRGANNTAADALLLRDVSSVASPWVCHVFVCLDLFKVFQQ